MMLRKGIRAMLIGAAVAVAVFCVASRFTYIHWRFVPLATDAWTWSVTIIGSQETVGIDTATYYVADPPDSSTLWVINDRVFKISHKIDTGSASVNWGESGVTQFAGVKRLSMHMVWWAALLLSGISLLFAFMGLVLGRRSARRIARGPSRVKASEKPAHESADAPAE